MKRNYQNLTGDIVIRKIREKNIVTAILCVLTYFILAAVIVYLLNMTARTQKYITAIFGILVCCIIAAVAMSYMKKSVSVLKDVSHAKVFRKYGSPQNLAEIISTGAKNPLLDSNRALIADTFIMNHNDFETYIPFTDILLCYKKEQRTNGVLTAIFLVIHDAYGEKFEYPFKMGKKHESEMITVMKHISEQAPNAAFGYTQQNLAYAETKKIPIPE